MTEYTHPHTHNSYPSPRSSRHDSHRLNTSTDQQYSDPTLTLSFVDGQSSFNQSSSEFAPSGQSATTTVDLVDDLGFSPLTALTSTPLSTTDSLGRTQVLQATSSGSSHCDGRKQPKGDPWTSVAVTGQPVALSNHQQHLAVLKDQYQPPHTDSGYEGSLLSASLMPVSRLAQKGRSPFQDDTLMAEMDRVLPDQQMSVAPLPASRPRSISASTVRPDSAEKFHCATCNIKFSTSSEHQKHMARHEKKHKCMHADCTRHAGFATSNDLDRHRRGVHNDIGLEDPVWKCFVEGCKSADKTWPRQDNFCAHIKRMHPEVDIAEFVRISDAWFENEEKPRRQAAFATRAPEMNQNPNQDPTIGQFHQYSGAMSEQNYAASHADPSEYARSIAGEFPDSQIQTMWGVGAGQSVSQQYSDVYSPSYPTPAALGQYPAMDDLPHGYSMNPIPSFSSMTHSGQQNDPPLPFAHRDNEFYVNDVGFSNVVKPFKTRTLPDQERMNNPYFPDWQTYGYETAPLTADIAPMNSQLDLSFMGGDHTTPTIQFPEGDVLSSDTPSSAEPGTTEIMPTAEEITEKNNQELQHEVDQLLSKCSDPHLAQKLKDTIAKAIKDHATSTTVNVGSTEASHDQGASYQCSRTGCNKTFAKKNRLTKHEKRHDRIFFCTFDKCYKSFGTKTDLSRHEYRVHKQARVWRCWANNRTRDRNKQCAMLFTDEALFSTHRRECHSKIQWTLEAFKVERDFSGAFWCGFCNAVVQNPVGVEVDGLKRVQHRYQHIEHHMNDIYLRSPGHDAMQDWYELAGEGKTKAEIKKGGRVTQNKHEEDDSDDEDDVDGSPPQHVTMQPNRQRNRALTDSKSYQGSQFLQVPEFSMTRRRPTDLNSLGMPRKRSAEFPTPEMPRSQMLKARKIQAPRSVAGSTPVQRHLSVSSAGGAPSGTSQQPSGEIPSQHIVAYIKCCKCNANPRPNEGYRTCNNCFEPNCENCSYFSIDKQPLRVTLNAAGRNTI